MGDFSSSMLIPLTLRFFDRVVEKAKFKRKSEAAVVFGWMRVQIPMCCMMSDGQKMMSFARNNAEKGESEEDFRDLIKTIWTVARDADASPKHRLICFFIGAGCLAGHFFLSAHAPAESKLWVDNVEDGIATFLSQINRAGTKDGPSKKHQPHQNKYKSKEKANSKRDKSKEHKKGNDYAKAKEAQKSYFKDKADSSKYSNDEPTSNQDKAEPLKKENIGAANEKTDEPNPRKSDEKSFTDPGVEKEPQECKPTTKEEPWFSKPKPKYQPYNYEPSNYESVPTKPIIKGKKKSPAFTTKPEGKSKSPKPRKDAKSSNSKTRDSKGSVFKNVFKSWSKSDNTKNKSADEMEGESGATAKESTTNPKEEAEGKTGSDGPKEANSTYRSSRYDKWANADDKKHEPKDTNYESKEQTKSNPIIKGKTNGASGKGKKSTTSAPRTRYERWFKNQKGEGDGANKETSTPKEKAKTTTTRPKRNGSRTRYEQWAKVPGTDDKAENDVPKTDKEDGEHTGSADSENGMSHSPEDEACSSDCKEKNTRKTRYEKWRENQRSKSELKSNLKSRYQKWLKTQTDDEDPNMDTIQNGDGAGDTGSNEQEKDKTARSRYKNWVNKSFSRCEEDGNSSFHDANSSFCDGNSSFYGTTEDGNVSFSETNDDANGSFSERESDTSFSENNEDSSSSFPQTTDDTSRTFFQNNAEALASIPETDNENYNPYETLV